MNLIRNAYTVYRALQCPGTLRALSVVANSTTIPKKRPRKIQQYERELEMKEHVKKLDPEDVEYLSDNLIKRIHQVKTRGDHSILYEGRMSLWDYLVSYNHHFDEKAQLVDRHVASKIATGILLHSDAKYYNSRDQKSQQSFFVDANGGLCRVTDEIINQCNNTNHIYSCFKIFEKDVNLVLLLQRARDDYLKSNNDNKGNVISIMNVNQIVVRYLACHNKSEFLSEFYERILVNNPIKPWNDVTPVYTLYMSATFTTIKYFINQCLTRGETCLNEMSRGRPEFFFIITPRTWAHLTLGTSLFDVPCKSLTRTKNILFNLLFEYKLIDTLPRKSFIPWPKPSKEKRSRSPNKEINKLDENVYLVWTRFNC